MRVSGHLLVVDDAPESLKLMVATLERDGHRVRPADSGELALAAIAHERPELILLDLRMPGFGGLALCDYLKADPILKNIPVVFISGADDVAERLEGLRRGAVDFIIKPFNGEELLARVHNHIELERLRARLLQQSQELQKSSDRLAAEIAERRLAQEALEEKASRLALATQAGEIGIWDWDVLNDRIHWDDTLRQIYGIARDGSDTSYAAWAILLHPADRARCRAETLAALSGECEYRSEYRIIRPDGTLRYLRARAVVQRDAAGDAVRLLGINWDITAQTLNQERLLLFSRAVEQSSASVVISGVRGEIEYANERFTRLTGFSVAEVIGRDLRVVMPAETSGVAFDEMWRVVSAGEIWTGEFQNRTKAGQSYWEAATIVPIKGDDGQISHFIASKEDITARRAAESALRHEQWLINCLMESAPALIFFKDASGRFIRVNQAQAALFGVTSPDEVLGRTDENFYAEADAVQAHNDEQVILNTGQPLLGKLQKMTLRDGNIRWFSASKMPLRDSSGKIIGTFGLTTDVTAQVQGEAERINLQLQLTQAQKLESIGRLASGIAHEINTPVQFVSDNISYVAKAVGEIDRVLVAHAALVARVKTEPLPPEILAILSTLGQIKISALRREVPAALTDARDGMARITRIVRAMKSFSHPGGEKMVPTDLNQAIESTLIVCRNEWKYVAELATHYAPELPLVPCLSGDFSQVILNLVVNAAHAISDVAPANSGHMGRITVTTGITGEWAEVRIEDTGTGIPESARPHMFEPFFTTKDVGKGTGQGLAMARSVIVDRHKGSLSFETEIGRGTTFIIRLPLR